jgi:hypothetical protein
MVDLYALRGDPRVYRDEMAPPGLIRSDVTIGQSDLAVFAPRDVCAEATRVLQEARRELLSYIQIDPVFARALRPVLPLPGAPRLVEKMIAAGAAAGVGPMAAVAGAIAEIVARGLLQVSDEVIVENGGDIYLVPRRVRRIAVQPGASSSSVRLALEIRPQDGPVAVCTSSGTLGHSISFGRADASVAVARDGALADAAATAIGNLVQSATDIAAALAFAETIPGLIGSLVIVDGSFGAWGELRLVDPAVRAAPVGGYRR